jgi:4-amino-4-deoxy-L-arabinose transferase-like glycosyltransferase
MLLVVLFAAGLVVALGLALLMRGARARLIVAGIGVIVFAGWAVYIEAIASCPAVGECEKGLGVFLLSVVLAGWLVGVALSWLIRRPTRGAHEGP